MHSVLLLLLVFFSRRGAPLVDTRLVEQPDEAKDPGIRLFLVARPIFLGGGFLGANCSTASRAWLPPFGYDDSLPRFPRVCGPAVQEPL